MERLKYFKRKEELLDHLGDKYRFSFKTNWLDNEKHPLRLNWCKEQFGDALICQDNYYPTFSCCIDEYNNYSEKWFYIGYSDFYFFFKEMSDASFFKLTWL